MIADFAARVAKAATEESDSVSTSASETAPNTTQTTAQTSLSNVQTNSSNDTNSQCNTGPPTPTQKTIAGAGASNIASTINSQSLGTCSNSAPQVDANATKTESKALQLPIKEFQPRSETKTVTIEESSPVVSPMVAVATKDTVSVQLTSATNSEIASATATATVEIESEVAGTGTTTSATSAPAVPANVAATAAIATAATAATTATGAVAGTGFAPEAAKSVNVASNVIQSPITPYWSNIAQELPKPSATASNNPVPTREPFPNLSAKTSSNSPPRRKPNAANEPPSNTKEQKERKTREKSLGSRGATPTPVHNQAADHHHQKTNGDAAGDKAEAEVLPRNEIQQKPSDGEYKHCLFLIFLICCYLIF